MTEDQSVVILRAISDARNESTKAIGALSTTVAGFHADLNARASAVEDDMKTQKTWGRINALLVPFYAFAHGVAARYGIKV